MRATISCLVPMGQKKMTQIKGELFCLGWGGKFRGMRSERGRGSRGICGM